IDTTAADLDRQRQRQQVQNAAQATKAGAWRGDALAVTNALSDETWNRNLASTLAGLRQQGFTQATQNAQQDLARRQAAEVANQAADLNVAGANAQATTAANQFNAGQAQTRSLADAAAANTALGAGAAARNAASLADSDAGLRAALANQSALETANQQRLTSAGLLGDFSDRELSQAAQRASLVGAVGDAQQQQNQAQLDWQYQNDYQAPRDYAVGMQQLLNQSLGLVPATGTTSANSSGTETVKQSPGLTGILGGLGGLFQGMSGLGFQLPA
ncbi:MAG TPA: hypothetical protein VG939_05000, partial [Caulobacteraceae bacterium]|nr:hypothetical protein [Caulobacteraceae bacterium]